MPAQVLNGPAVAVHMYQALFGQAPSNALYASYISQIGSTDGAAFAASIAGGFASTTDAALATKVLANLGVTATTMPATATVTAAAAYTALETALTSMFTGYGVAARGQIILNMTNLLANLEGDATFGTIASTYNNQTLSNFTYSSNTTNTTAAAVTPAVVAAGQTFTLTAGADSADVAGSFRNGGTVDAGFKFTTSNETVNGSTTTLTAVDSLADSSTTDTDVLNVSLTGALTTALVQNIETFNFNTTGVTAATAITLTGVTGLKTINLTGTSAGALTIAGSALGVTGVTTVDASGVSTNVAFTADSSTSIATANLTLKGAAIGTNTLSGGLGNDTITGGTGTDTINGGAGNDIIDAGNGTNTVNGGSGNDTITTGTGNDTITDTIGNNIINAGNGTNSITVGTGNDTITGGTGVDTIITGGGNDVVQGAGGADVITLTVTANAANSETLKFEATAAANGTDTVNTFLAGAIAVGGDVLNVGAFTGAITNFVQIVGAVIGGNNVATSNVVVSDATLAASQAAGLVFKASSNIVFISDDAADANVNYITTDANGTVISSASVAVLVGLGNTTTLVAAEFI